jgi:hypothetical protein
MTWKKELRMATPATNREGMTDRDGKSKTASGVDADHYPEQNEVDESPHQIPEPPSHEDIAIRAYELWQGNGCPDGCADEHWFLAEQELLNGRSQRMADKLHQSSGSVQR